jgi:hypothetical protein
VEVWLVVLVLVLEIVVEFRNPMWREVCLDKLLMVMDEDCDGAEGPEVMAGMGISEGAPLRITVPEVVVMENDHEVSTSCQRGCFMSDEG